MFMLLFPSDDAPLLEGKLHRKFESYRLNKTNYRKEFFKVSMEKIEAALNESTDESFNLINDSSFFNQEDFTLVYKKDN